MSLSIRRKVVTIPKEVYFLDAMWREHYQQFMKHLRHPRYYNLKDATTKRMNMEPMLPTYAAICISGSMKFLERALQIKKVGLMHMLQMNTVVEERDEYIVLHCQPSREVSPSIIPELILPDVPDPNTGVVIKRTRLHWFDAHLVVEYSKVASWVAIEITNGVAVIVHTTLPNEYPLGKVFKF